MARGLLLDFEAIAHHADRDPAPLLQEIRTLGYEVYTREFMAVCDYVRFVEVPRHGHDTAERFLEAVFREFDLKLKRTELMSLAPVFEELHRYVLFEDVPRALPALAKGHRIAVLACLSPFLVAPAIEPVRAHVAALVTPKEAKATLPSPKVFHTALAALKLRPRDVVFAGATCPDLAVAQGLGMRTVFVRRQGTEQCEGASAAVASLDELEPELRHAKSDAISPPKGAVEVATVQSR